VFDEKLTGCGDRTDTRDPGAFACDFCGDATGDFRITAPDALQINRNAVGVEGASCEECRCDVNGDNTVVTTDARMALLRAVGLSVPVNCDCVACTEDEQCQSARVCDNNTCVTDQPFDVLMTLDKDGGKGLTELSFTISGFSDIVEFNDDAVTCKGLNNDTGDPELLKGVEPGDQCIGATQQGGCDKDPFRTCSQNSDCIQLLQDFGPCIGVQNGFCQKSLKSCTTDSQCAANGRTITADLTSSSGFRAGDDVGCCTGFKGFIHSGEDFGTVPVRVDVPRDPNVKVTAVVAEKGTTDCSKP